MAMRTSVITRSRWCGALADGVAGFGLAGLGFFLLDFAMAVWKCDSFDCRSGALSFFSGSDGAIITSCCRAVGGGEHKGGDAAQKKAGISFSGGAKQLWEHVPS